MIKLLSNLSNAVQDFRNDYDNVLLPDWSNLQKIVVDMLKTDNVLYTTIQGFL